MYDECNHNFVPQIILVSLYDPYIKNSLSIGRNCFIDQSFKCNHINFFHLNCTFKLEITVILINKGHKPRRFGRLKNVKKNGNFQEVSLINVLSTRRYERENS